MIPSIARRATIAVADLYIEGGAAPIPARILAEYQNCSVPSLEAPLSMLCRAGVLKSTRGASGGYSLARPAEEIYLSRIWFAVGFEARGSAAPTGSGAFASALANVHADLGAMSIADLMRRGAVQ